MPSYSEQEANCAVIRATGELPFPSRLELSCFPANLPVSSFDDNLIEELRDPVSTTNAVTSTAPPKTTVFAFHTVELCYGLPLTRLRYSIDMPFLMYAFPHVSRRAFR